MRRLLLEECTHDMSLKASNCENSTVLCHEVLSDFNCFQESCISSNFLPINLVVEHFPLVPCTFALNFLVRESQ